MKTENIIHKSIGVISLVVIIVASFIIYRNVFVPTWRDKIVPTVATSTPVTTSTTTETGIYFDIEEKDFVLFASSNIEKRCPFYVPDGSSYRECLSDWMNSIQLKAIDEEITEVNNYCQTFTAKYQDTQSLAGSELFMKCVIFTFSK